MKNSENIVEIDRLKMFYKYPMNAKELDYELPNERIARFPSEKRDESRLLVFERKSGKITHTVFKNLPEFISPNFDLFRNDASVLKGRIFAHKSTGAEVECLLLKPEGAPDIWSCMLKPGKRLPVGSTFGVDGEFSASVVEKKDDGQAIVKFELENSDSVISLTEKIGVVPLPPYIARDQHSPNYDRDFDNSRYQTVYADPSKRVAAAAPTAGLHFTKHLEAELIERGNTFYNLTLHVGIGTFQPLKSEVVEEHKMHAEFYEIGQKTLRRLASRVRPNLAIGTTSLRAMEDFSRKHPIFSPDDFPNGYLDSANLFVYPPQTIVSADALITNFHLPRSTLMCLVGTFLAPASTEGIKILKEIYAEAIAEKYNFYSYGDAMLVL